LIHPHVAEHAVLFISSYNGHGCTLVTVACGPIRFHFALCF
jgi:hypothetical protein